MARAIALALHLCPEKRAHCEQVLVLAKRMRQALSGQKAETKLAHQWLKNGRDMAAAGKYPLAASQCMVAGGGVG